MHCERNETVPRVVSGSGLDIVVVRGETNLLPIGRPGGVYAVVVPTLAKYAKDGAPAVSVGFCSLKAGPTRQMKSHNRVTDSVFYRRSSAFIRAPTGFALEGLRDAERVYERTTRGRARDTSSGISATLVPNVPATFDRAFQLITEP